jgi:hypothetical protein
MKIDEMSMLPTSTTTKDEPYKPEGKEKILQFNVQSHNMKKEYMSVLMVNSKSKT